MGLGAAPCSLLQNSSLSSNCSAPRDSSCSLGSFLGQEQPRVGAQNLWGLQGWGGALEGFSWGPCAHFQVNDGSWGWLGMPLFSLFPPFFPLSPTPPSLHPSLTISLSHPHLSSLSEFPSGSSPAESGHGTSARRCWGNWAAFLGCAGAHPALCALPSCRCPSLCSSCSTRSGWCPASTAAATRCCRLTSWPWRHGLGTRTSSPRLPRDPTRPQVSWTRLS